MESISKQKTELKKLEFLIGKWQTQGIVKATSNSPEIKINGTDSYEFIANEFFILHVVDVTIGEEKVDNVEIIYFDEDSNSFLMQSFDNLGKPETMWGKLTDSAFIIEGDNVRSKLAFNLQATEMAAFWDRSDDGTKWIPWMDLKLTK